MTPEDEAFALMCGREDRNAEYRQEAHDMRAAGYRYRPGSYGGYYRTYPDEEE